MPTPTNCPRMWCCAALLNADSAYFVPHFAVTWTIYWSGLPANVRSRGVGEPQAVAAIENVIEEIARHLTLDPLEVRRRNCYGGPARNTTHFGQTIAKSTLPVLIDQLAESSGYDRRREAALRFNEGSHGHRRGLALTPVKYGNAHASQRRHDGHAQVNIEPDGTINVAIGRPKMGPTARMIFHQQIADHFGAAIEAVKLTRRSSAEPDTAPAPAHDGVDLDGPAAFRACELLRDRLARLAARHLAAPAHDEPTAPGDIRFERGRVFDVRRPDRCLSFTELVSRAHAENLDLSAKGFSASPATEIDCQPAHGYPFMEFASGAAVSEVELDRAIGQLSVLRVDILIDIGHTSYPANDRAEVFARFIQGLGWATSDRRPASRVGDPLADATDIDNVVTFDGLPDSVKIDFLESDPPRPNAHADPPIGALSFLLAVSVWAAAKQALASLLAGRSLNMNLPITTEEVQRCLALSGEARSATSTGSGASG